MNVENDARIAKMCCLMLLTLAAWTANATEPFGVPTFHSLGIYWSPAGGGAERPVAVEYRGAGSAGWLKAMPLRYNPIAGTDLDRGDYRGSIVNLTPGTRYEIRLRLEGPGPAAGATFPAATWNENFPIGKVEKIASRDTTLEIKESGTPEAYRVYDGTGSTIDVKHAANHCITVNAHHVILRGFTLMGAGVNKIARGPYAGAIQLEGGHDIVIERCDISDWGRPHDKPLSENRGRDMESGVGCNKPEVARVIIQRCRIHHPARNANHWYAPFKPSHPEGPQCVCFIESAGNHVIRYNEFYSDLEHMFNDVLGGGSNSSYRGFPGPDTDIYCNTLSHCWDDALELEGSVTNVRAWNNYITQAAMGLGNASVSIGPLYFWRNVVDRTEWYPNGPAGQFVKMGFGKSEQWMTGQQYFFHNTVYQDAAMKGCGQGIGGGKVPIAHTTTRNNIIHLRRSSGVSISSNLKSSDCDFDFDLYMGAVPAGHERHGVKGAPRYAAGAGFDASTKRGHFQLAQDSPGFDAGEAIPNFSDGYTGKAPDIGAHEHGWNALQYGVDAVFTPSFRAPFPGSARPGNR